MVEIRISGLAGIKASITLILILFGWIGGIHCLIGGGEVIAARGLTIGDLDGRSLSHTNRMIANDPNARTKASRVVEYLASARLLQYLWTELRS